MLALATELVLETRVESPSVKPGPFEWVLSERSLPSGLVERVVLTETEA